MMPAYDIQQVRDVDVVWAELRTLFLALHDHHVPLGEPLFVADWERHWRDHFNTGERLVLIARHEGTAVGLLTARIQRTAGIYDEAYGFLEDAFVAPEHRGSGLAQELVGRAERWCISRGMKVLRLSVLVANELAAHFWEKSGFRPYMMIVSKDLAEAPA